eukprot:scaffold43710_cov17-Tisochrysis_lutea.AAC.1
MGGFLKLHVGSRHSIFSKARGRATSLRTTFARGVDARCPAGGWWARGPLPEAYSGQLFCGNSTRQNFLAPCLKAGSVTRLIHHTEGTEGTDCLLPRATGNGEGGPEPGLGHT